MEIRPCAYLIDSPGIPGMPETAVVSGGTRWRSSAAGSGPIFQAAAGRSSTTLWRPVLEREPAASRSSVVWRC